jgi:aminoglycoside N3'-acetyltransferase
LGLSENEEERPSVGTLAVPTFNFAFARGEPFDLRNTPSVGMGAFSEYIRQRASARRPPHLLQSIAVIGRYVDDLASRDTPAAFDPGSPFDRMLELDFKILLLGADVQAISLLHWVEQRLQVPYRYWKVFRGPVRTGDK